MDTATAGIETMIEYAWCHVYVDRRRFVELVDEIAWWVDRWGADNALRARTTILQSIAETIGGRWQTGGALARQALESMDGWWWKDPFGPFGWNMVARQIALSEAWDDDADEVRQAEMALVRDPRRRVAFEGTRALGEALAGRPVDALRVAAGVRGVAVIENVTMLGGELRAAEAISHREIGERARALVELEALARDPAEPLLYCRVLALLELTRAHLDDNDVAGATELFAETRSLVDNESFGADGRQWLARTGITLGLATGDLSSAAAWSRQIQDSFWGPIERGPVGLGRRRPERSLGHVGCRLAALSSTRGRPCPAAGANG